MAHHTSKIGGDVVAKVGHGLMSMTWTSTPVPDEQAFATIKAGIDALPPGVKMFLNSAEFYGQGLSTANLKLLARFFERYPGYADRTFLSVKGGGIPGQLVADGSRKNLRRSVDAILKALRGTKKLDLFEPARLDPNYEIEQYAGPLNEMVKEGKFDYIGLSAVGAETVRRAHKVMPVAAVEIEVNLPAYGRQMQDVISTCKELGIAVVGYSPLGRGLLTDHIASRLGLGQGDCRRSFSRDLVDTLSTVSNSKGISIAQLNIAWVGALGRHVIPLPGSSNVRHTLENLLAGDVRLSTEEWAVIAQLLEKYPRRNRDI